MAAVCGTIRLLLFLNFLTFVLYLKSTKTVKHQANGHDSLVVLSLKHWSINVRRFNRLKISLVKWTKHGFVVLQLYETSDILRFCGQEIILQSGDVHPQPGPAAGKNDCTGPAERTSRVTYSLNELTHYRKINNSSQCIDPVLRV